MRYFPLLFFLSSSSFLFAQSYPSVGKPIACEEKVLLSHLKGIILKSSSSIFPGNPDLVKGVRILDDVHFPGKKSAFADMLTPLMQRELTPAGIEEIRYKITKWYTDHDYPLVSVIVPPQDITAQVMQFVIVEGTLGTLKLEGNQWTSDHFLEKSIDLQKGERINSAELKRNLAWLNRNPFRQTDAIFHPGLTAKETDLDLVTKDRFPLQPYIGADNTGTSFTERTRLYTGLNAGNIWGIDHRASYQYTTSPNSTSFSAQSGSYTAPFPWHHQAHVYGGWARGKAHLQQDLHHHAQSWQVSIRYQIPLNPIYGHFIQEISFGYDFKRTNNSLLFGGIRVSNKFADTNQFMFGYLLDYHTCKSKTSFLLEVYGSFAELTAHQNKTDYRSVRPYANPLYVYGRARLSETYLLPKDFVLKALFAAQATGWNLLPNEMFGLGGYNTVRGYDERAVNADDAILASFEVDSPGLHFLKKKTKDKLDFLAFFDYGFGVLQHPSVGDHKTYWLAGTGFGLRYSIGTYLFFRMDLGFPLHKTGFGLKGPHVHVGATVSY